MLAPTVHFMDHPGAGVTQPPVSPMPAPELVKELVTIGFAYVRHEGIFELFSGADQVVFSISFESWRADPAACDENLRRAVTAWLRRRQP